MYYMLFRGAKCADGLEVAQEEKDKLAERDHFAAVQSCTLNSCAGETSRVDSGYSALDSDCTASK